MVGSFGTPTEQAFSKGEVIVKEGHEGSVFYIIATGEVEVSKQGAGLSAYLGCLLACMYVYHPRYPCIPGSALDFVCEGAWNNKPVELHLVFHRQPAVPIVGFVFARIRVVTGVVKSLRHGDYFGEKAILTGEKRNATCTAAVSASCTIWGRHFIFLPREQPPFTRFPSRIYLHRDVS